MEDPEDDAKVKGGEKADHCHANHRVYVSDAVKSEAKPVIHVNEWVELFNEAGYTGDYYWFMP